MEMLHNWEIMTSEPHDRQITTDRLLDQKLALLKMAMAPIIKIIVIMFFLGNISLGNWEAGLDPRHQSSVHLRANVANYLGGLLHSDPEPNQLQNLVQSEEPEFVSSFLAVKEVAQADIPRWLLIRRDRPFNCLFLHKTLHGDGGSSFLTVKEVAQTDKPHRWPNRRDKPFNCLILSKTLHRDGGRGRPVAGSPRINDNTWNWFSLSQVEALPGSGRAGVHLWIISNRDQMLKPGRQHSLHKEQRQFGGLQGGSGHMIS